MRVCFFQCFWRFCCSLLLFQFFYVACSFSTFLPFLFLMLLFIYLLLELPLVVLLLFQDFLFLQQLFSGSTFISLPVSSSVVIFSLLFYPHCISLFHVLKIFSYFPLLSFTLLHLSAIPLDSRFFINIAQQHLFWTKNTWTDQLLNRYKVPITL